MPHMSSESDGRNNELKKANERVENSQNDSLTKQDPTQPVEAKEAGLDRAQNNQKEAAKSNNPQSETGPAETLRSKAAKAEDKSQDSREPA